MSSPRKLKDYFERIYVINLPYKECRRARLERHLLDTGLIESGDVDWVRAISGDWCPPPEYFDAGGGAWGCLQSHIRIVQDAIMDGLENYLVLEDDVVFRQDAPSMLERLMRELPDDWGQLYLGGQHLQTPDDVEGAPFLFSCKNINRTHAFALNRGAMRSFQQHICHAPDYIEKGSWHVDHQLGIAHERCDWRTYAPKWWLAGQEEGQSNISGQSTVRLWWNYHEYSKGLPFIFIPPELEMSLDGKISNRLHPGNNLKSRGYEDIGLDGCLNHDERLRDWLAMIAREAMDMGLLPAIQHPRIPIERVRSNWASGAIPLECADLDLLHEYPQNGLFSHPLNGEMARGLVDREFIADHSEDKRLVNAT